MLFRRSGSELFNTFTNIILLRIFPLKNIYSRKMRRKLKWQILAARYNWCQGPGPGRGPAVEIHWPRQSDTMCYKISHCSRLTRISGKRGVPSQWKTSVYCRGVQIFNAQNLSRKRQQNGERPAVHLHAWLGIDEELTSVHQSQNWTVQKQARKCTQVR
jgi:hypothetical protein